MSTDFTVESRTYERVRPTGELGSFGFWLDEGSVSTPIGMVIAPVRPLLAIVLLFRVVGDT